MGIICANFIKHWNLIFWSRILDIRKFAFIALSRAARLELFKIVLYCEYSVEYLYRVDSTDTENIWLIDWVRLNVPPNTL